MKLTLWIAVIIVLAAFMADTKITLKPFSVSFGRVWLLVAYVLFLAGAFCLRLQYYTEAYEKGLRKGAEIQKEVIEEVKRDCRQKPHTN